MSKWWWIGLLIAWVVFVIIGGGLIGAWASSSTSCSSYSYYYSYSCSDGDNSLYYGGIACFAIAGVLHLAYWVVLIVWCTKRNRLNASVTYINAPVMEGGAKPYGFTHPPPHPIPSPTPVYQQPSEIMRSPSDQGGKFCGNCGAAVGGQFCSQCGTRN